MISKTNVFLENVKRIILEKDLDWLHVIVGKEGVGKSSLGIYLCRTFDPNFSIENIVFDINELKDRVRNSKPGDAILIDEGALIFFSTDSHRKETKEGIKLLTAMREFNLFVVICIPNFWILSRYIREHRVKTISRVVKRGWYWHFSPRKVRQIERDKVTLKTIWPDWDFRDSFPDGSTWEYWEDYKQKKRQLAIERDKKHKKPKKKKGKTVREKIEELVRKHPDWTGVMIAKEIGTSPVYVRQIRGTMDIER